MRAYLIPLSISSDQAVILDQLKNAGCLVIQTANGLCVKCEKSRKELEELLGIAVNPLGEEALAKSTEDIRTFVSAN